jgi:hypothetical protein
VSPFHEAFTAATAAIKAARHVSDLEYRVNMRYRLWERGEDPAVLACAVRLTERKRTTVAAAEDAEWNLSELWDRVSRDLPPLAPSLRLA